MGQPDCSPSDLVPVQCDHCMRIEYLTLTEEFSLSPLGPYFCSDRCVYENQLDMSEDLLDSKEY